MSVEDAFWLSVAVIAVLFAAMIVVTMISEWRER